MRRKDEPKLALKRQDLRALLPAQLAHVQGGVAIIVGSNKACTARLSGCIVQV